MKKILINFLSLLLLISFSLIGVRFLFQSGFFPMHDDTQVARVYEMAQALKQGQFPVRWVGDLGYGYGYPLFNFYNPLAYYFGGFLILLGFDALVATKIMFIFGFLLAGISMYLLSRFLYDWAGGLLAAALYVFAPYHAVQLYVRGSIAELWAYGILPLVFLGILKKNYFLTGASLALLILSHNLTIIMVLPFIFILFISLMKKSLFHCFIASLLIAFSLSAFFWLPAITEKKYTAVDKMVNEQFNPLLHFVYPYQLWNSTWGYAGSAPANEADGMSFQIGKPNLILTIAAILLIILIWKSHQKNLKIILSFIVFWLLSIFLLLPISAPIWQVLLPITKYLQFPWRFLSLVSLFGSVISGLLIYKMKNLSKIVNFGFLSLSIIFILFFNLKYFSPQYLYAVEARDFLQEEKIKWQTSLSSDEYLPSDFPKPQKWEEVPKEKFQLQLPGEIKILRRNTADYLLEIKTSQQNTLTVNTVYFPGWQVWSDQQKIDIDSQEHLIKTPVSAGQHEIKVKFTDTPVRSISNIISLMGLIAFLGLIFLKRLSKN